MNPLPVLATLACGGMLLAGCNPDKDQANSITDEDQTTAPAAPADVPPPPDTTGPAPGSETIPPPTDAYPADQPPGSPPAPDQEPPPPPNG